MDRVSRLHEHSRMLWCLPKIYYVITSPNLRPAQLSTKVTPAKNVIICFGKKRVLVVWFVDMDRGS